MPTPVQHHRSTSAGNVPSSLVDGEFAYNIADRRIFAGNSTVIWDALQSSLANLTITTSTATIGFRVGNSTVNATMLPTGLTVGANVSIGPGIFFTGNSTVNSVSNSISHVLSNSTVSSTFSIGSLAVGANAAINTTAVLLGNSTVNTVFTSVLWHVGNSTANAFVNSTSFAIANATGTFQLFPIIPQNPRSAAYTTTISDVGSHIHHPSSDNNARTFTIANNSSVPYPIGTTITFINSANVLTIAIATDTMIFAANGATGSRTLANNGIATATKYATTTWLISGAGLT
jgi:hypothetical protein